MDPGRALFYHFEAKFSAVIFLDAHALDTPSKQTLSSRKQLQ